MSSIEFEDQSGSSNRRQFQYQNTLNQSFLVRHNIAKDEESAQKIMYVLLAVLIILTLFMIGKIRKDNGPKEVKYNFSDDVIIKLPAGLREKIILE